MEKNLSNHLCHLNPLSAFEVFSDVVMMGSGSTNPCMDNENVRVYQPTLILQSDPGTRRPPVAPPSPVQPINESDYSSLLKTMTEHYNQFLKSATQLNDAQKQRALEGGADAGMRREVTRLESENAELSTAIRDLANSESRVLQLQLSLDEIRVVFPDSWGY
ncbi:hypothetical protein MKX03_022671 [Papaver bracteatum]|nr:hypothetical protein MKX03_022671 [Papaver bracteatum]